MKSRFLVLHGAAITLHLICAIYAFASPSLLEGSIPLKLETKAYTNLSIAYPYYRDSNVIVVSFPSVVVVHGLVALVTVLFHAFAYLPIHYRFSELIWDQGFLSVRWLEYAITCTLMTMSSVFAAGTSDFNFAATLAFGGIALQMIGCAIEQLKSQWLPLFVLGIWIELSLGWSIVWYTISSPAITSLQWIEVLSYVAYYSLFPLNCVVDAVCRKKRFIETDWIYNLLSLSSKLALFWLQVGKLDKNVGARHWPTLQIYGLGVVLPFAILLAGLCFIPKRRIDESAEPDALPTARVWIMYYYISKCRLFVPVKGEVRTVFVTKKGRLR